MPYPDRMWMVYKIHSEISLPYTVETTEKSLNCFSNQVILEEARCDLNFSQFPTWIGTMLRSNWKKNCVSDNQLISTNNNRAHRAGEVGCTKAKYDQQFKKQNLRNTRIPTYAGEILHGKIFSTDKKQV